MHEIFRRRATRSLCNLVLSKLALTAAVAALGLGGCRASDLNGGGPGGGPGGNGPPPITATFDADAEGWNLQGFNTDGHDYVAASLHNQPALWDATGGDPGGAAMRHETFYAISDYFEAPAAFLGDRSAYQGGTLRFELRRSDPPSPYAAPLVILEGGGVTFIYTGGHDAEPTWSAYTVPLDAGAGWTHVDETTPVTADEMHLALASLTALWIRGEFVNGSDQGWLDNVSFSSH